MPGSSVQKLISPFRFFFLKKNSLLFPSVPHTKRNSLSRGTAHRISPFFPRYMGGRTRELPVADEDDAIARHHPPVRLSISTVVFFFLFSFSFSFPPTSLVRPRGGETGSRAVPYDYLVGLLSAQTIGPSYCV